MTQQAPTRHRQGNLSVYSAAAATSSMVPVPGLSEWLNDLTRGSVMRRIALRNGIGLTPEGREELSKSEIATIVHNTRLSRFARTWIGRTVAPARIIGGIEDGLAALLAATLLDHYLKFRPHPKDKPIDRLEAAHIRAAMRGATEGGLLAISKAAPKGVGQALQQIGKALEKASAEGRSVPERVMDTVLDTLADMPENALQVFIDRFDAVIRRDENNVETATVIHINGSDTE